MQLSKFLFKNISKLLSQKGVYIIKSLSYKKKKPVLPANADYVRYSTLELCYQEITEKNIRGNVAELGVYKGDFARRLNLLFSDRTLYLFDTFEGFDKRDINTELNNEFSKGNQDFTNTNVEDVMSKMRFPEKCVIKKGFFPETATGLNDTFCFVNIDTDLYDPILNGLDFFYPRLEQGGFIFVHDFNNDNYKGARQAVLKYCNENKIGYIPLPDNCGTAVITK